MVSEMVQTVRSREEGVDNKVRREYARNFRYFHRNYQMLMEEHPDKHVVICDRDVCDSDKDFNALLERTRKERNIRIVFFGYVSSPGTELIL